MEIAVTLAFASAIAAIKGYVAAGVLLFISLCLVASTIFRDRGRRCRQCRALYMNPDCETCRARSGF